MPTYNVRYVRVTGDDADLLLERQFFGTVGPWQDGAYYNNEVYRSHIKMNELCEKLAEEYAKCRKLTKKRNQIHRSIGNARFQKEGIGFVDEVKLDFFRKDKKPMEMPPKTWLNFVQHLKHGDDTDMGHDSGLETTVELADDAAGVKDYDIQPTKQNNNQKNRNRNNQNNQNGQN